MICDESGTTEGEISLDIYFRHGDPCEKCGHVSAHSERTVYDANITHNLNRMADEAGIYEVLWRPEENGIATAGQLIPHLERGIAAMEAAPARFRAFDAENGWGTYDIFLPWLRRLLEAAREYPGAKVEASR